MKPAKVEGWVAAQDLTLIEPFHEARYVSADDATRACLKGDVAGVDPTERFVVVELSRINVQLGDHHAMWVYATSCVRVCTPDRVNPLLN